MKRKLFENIGGNSFKINSNLSESNDIRPQNIQSIEFVEGEFNGDAAEVAVTITLKNNQTVDGYLTIINGSIDLKTFESVDDTYQRGLNQ